MSALLQLLPFGFRRRILVQELECNSPIVLTSWFTLANHFRVKWLRDSLTLLLESPETKQITITQSNTATTVSRETTTTTATDSNNATTTIEQRDNRETMVKGEEEAKGLEKQDETNE
jgi:hypothetical protein